MMALRMIAIITAIASVQLVHSSPTVTLQHGGILMGKSINFNNTRLDLFQGVRYAKPPTGMRRFTKPEPYPSWSGIKNATTVGNICPQGKSFGHEDCLFLDITVPHGVSVKTKRAVMVWIHGGSLLHGTGTAYFGAPLALVGDVIVVAINYRLGILGFLSDEQGSGNYGLWDQRQALLWVKENIEKFGGDPERITIFGESSGGVSVTAQLLGKHNDGLFKRAIIESGTLYHSWGWYLSVLHKHALIKEIRNKLGCASTVTTFRCARDLDPHKLLDLIPIHWYDWIWIPGPDNDFFNEEVVNEKYSLTRRFDVMTGFNKQEGYICVNDYFKPWADSHNQTLDTGVSVEWVKGFLSFICEKLFDPLSPELCANYIMNEYGMETITDDKARLIQLAQVCGEEAYDADTYRLLMEHANGNTSTYGYYFSEFDKSSVDISSIEAWAKTSATHGDELPYVFGYMFMDNNLTSSCSASYNRTESLTWYGSCLNYRCSNPADSGLDDAMKVWPKFSTDSRQFLMLDARNTTAISLPYEGRIISLLKNVFESRKLQTLAMANVSTISNENSKCQPDLEAATISGAVAYIATSSGFCRPVVTLVCIYSVLPHWPIA